MCITITNMPTFNSLLPVTQGVPLQCSKLTKASSPYAEILPSSSYLARYLSLASPTLPNLHLSTAA